MSLASALSVGVAAALVLLALEPIGAHGNGSSWLRVLAVLVGLGLASIPFVPRTGFVWWSLVTIVMLAVGNAWLNPSLVSILSRKAHPHELGEVMGQNMGFGSLGRVVGPALASLLYPLGMALPFWVGGAVMLGTLALVHHYLRTSYKPLVGATDARA